MHKSFLLLVCVLSCLPLLSNATIFNTILKATVSAVDLIREVIDMFTTSKEEKQLEELTKEMSTLKKTIDLNNSRMLQMIKENSYKTILTFHIDKIESCEKDYFNYQANKSIVARKNLEKCHDVIDNVRTLGKYLSGESIIRTPPLFDLYKDANGVCDGAVIDGVFKYVFTNLAVGCSVVRTTEPLISGHDTNLYGTECESVMNKVLKYMESVYKGCAMKSCITFHSNVQRQLAKYPSITLVALHEKLSEMYPWFNFLVFKMAKGGKATPNGNFSSGHKDDIWLQGYRYDIFYFDALVQISQQNQIYLISIEIHKNFLQGYHFGNLSLGTSHAAGSTFIVYQGYASVNNVYCAKPRVPRITYNTVWEETQEGGRGNGAAAPLFQLPVVWCILILCYILCG